MRRKLASYVIIAVFFSLVTYISFLSAIRKHVGVRKTIPEKPVIHVQVAKQHVRSYFESMNFGTRTRDCFLGKFCFNYLIMPKCECEDRVKTKVLAIVLSKMSNFERRQHIRNTWASARYYNKAELRVIFVLAVQKYSPVLEGRLLEESRLYNDLVVVDFTECYDNLTLKSLTGLHWITKFFCTIAEFVLKTDDDIFINTPTMIETMNGWIYNRNTTNIITGLLFPKNPVYRTGKHMVTKEMYDKDVYPPYVAGAAYILSKDVIPKLMALALNQTGFEFIRMEDAYITGVLAEKAKIVPTHFGSKQFHLVGKYPGMPDEHWRDYFVWHGVVTQEQTLDIWETLLRLSKTKLTSPVKVNCHVTNPKPRVLPKMQTLKPTVAVKKPT